MAEIRVWGVAGSGAFLVSRTVENDAIPIVYPDLSINEAGIIAIHNHKNSTDNKVFISFEEPYTDFRQKGGAAIGDPSKLGVLEYLLAQRGLQ